MAQQLDGVAVDLVHHVARTAGEAADGHPVGGVQHHLAFREAVVGQRDAVGRRVRRAGGEVLRVTVALRAVHRRSGLEAARVGIEPGAALCQRGHLGVLRDPTLGGLVEHRHARPDADRRGPADRDVARDHVGAGRVESLQNHVGIGLHAGGDADVRGGLHVHHRHARRHRHAGRAATDRTNDGEGEDVLPTEGLDDDRIAGHQIGAIPHVGMRLGGDHTDIRAEAHPGGTSDRQRARGSDDGEIALRHHVDIGCRVDAAGGRRARPVGDIGFGYVVDHGNREGTGDARGSASGCANGDDHHILG